MDGPTFADELREGNQTELSRLGSSKSLYALTGGEMDAPSVRAAADDEFETPAVIFGDWAEREENEDAAELFADAAEVAERHRDQVGSEEGMPDTDRDAFETLSGFETTQQRVGGLLGYLLVARKTTDQMVGFFVGSAEPSSADTFRDVRDDLDDLLTRTQDTLGAVCPREEYWDDAQQAAVAVVQAAYDDYVETLESMGVEPKNVC